MVLYFYLLPARLVHDVLTPALRESWLRRTFAPCGPLCRQLLERSPDALPDALLRQVAAGLPFSRHAWHGLIGECLLYGSVDMPLLQTAPAALRCLLAPDRAEDTPRAQFAPIQQALFGSRDLCFGGYYRPDHAGWNDRDDVARLLAYLEAQDPAGWRADALAPLADLPTAADREDELAFVRDWWPAHVELYRRAAREDLFVVCEQV